MSALIAGVDFSSKRLDCALIPLDPSDGSDAPPVTLRAWKMPTWKRETTPAFRSVERCRVVRDAMRELLRDVRHAEPPFKGTAEEYLCLPSGRTRICEARVLEQSSHYEGYVGCWNSSNRVVDVLGRPVAFCAAHGFADAPAAPLTRSEVAHVCVETPLGSKSRSTVLWELYGAILASIPSHIERDTITCQEWRSILIPEAWKRKAISDDWKTWAINYAGCWAGREGLNEHEAEATLIAVACRERLEAAVKGAA